MGVWGKEVHALYVISKWLLSKNALNPAYKVEFPQTEPQTFYPGLACQRSGKGHEQGVIPYVWDLLQ